MNSRPTILLRRLAAGASRNGVRWVSAKPKPEYRPYEEHAEKIFVIRHIERNHVIYSFTPTLSPSLIQRQVPFNGKKLYPARIRKDYWDTMAVIKFHEGEGEVGRSVFQRLREFRKRHELEWEEPLFELSRRERGEVLNNQRANSIADIAAVLAGAGKGNLIVEENKKPTRLENIGKDKAAKSQRKAAQATRAAGDGSTGAEGQDARAATTTEPTEPEDTTRTLRPVTVYWQDLMDAAYAKTWSENVSHAVLEPAMIGQTYKRNSRAERAWQTVEEPKVEVPEPKAEQAKPAATESV